MDANPYVGITERELDAIIRAAYSTAQLPAVLLALWAKEGSTRSHSSFVPVPGALSAENAKSLFRTIVFYVDLGADHFTVNAYDPVAKDNVIDRRDSAAPAHERRFVAEVRRLQREGWLRDDVSADINAELTVRPAGGRFEVKPSVRFYALSLLLVDALYTKMQRTSFPELESISPDLNYLQWNMGTAKFRRFLRSADRHRREARFVPIGGPISIEEWALHTVPRPSEWRGARQNAIRFMYYARCYGAIFQPWLNLINPGIEDLPQIPAIARPGLGVG